MNINREEIAAIDLTELSKFITDKEARDFFLAETGEHYKLLAWLSMQFGSQADIADIGTFKGCSALALSYDPMGWVHSFDISNNRMLNDYPPIIDFNLEGIEPEMEDPFMILNNDLIFLDTVHDGIHERKVIDFLIEHEWKGVLVLDDIHHFPEQNKLWNDITLRKEDVTDIGHWAGSGIIYFE